MKNNWRLRILKFEFKDGSVNQTNKKSNYEELIFNRLIFTAKIMFVG